jgi:long-chain acyl-CoA synthetase
VCNAYQTRRWLWSLEDGREVVLCVLPFFHSYGLTTGLHLAVIAQSTMLLLPRFELPQVAKQIRRYRPTVFCAVPSMYGAINRYPKLTPRDVSSIKVCVSGGAALPAQVQRDFEAKTGGRLVEGYGLTETSPVALVNPIHGYRKNGTIGVPISDTEAQVVDVEGKQPVGVGEVGELALRGPQLMKGYWNRPQETAEVLRNGWLYSGDMAVMDEEGFFRIVDRKKDVIISAGMNVYPREVEEILYQHPKIVEVAVVGVPSKVRGETVKAFIVVAQGESLSKREVVEFCRGKLSKFKVPKAVEFVEELPKSALGKVLKRVLREER